MKSRKRCCGTPAMYKRISVFEEVDALALANVRCIWKKHIRIFFRIKVVSPKFKSKHRSRKKLYDSQVNGNIQVEDHRIKLPKLSMDPV